MSDTKDTMNSKVETVDVNLDEIFNGAATAEGVTLPEETNTPKGNIFGKPTEPFDDAFTEPETSNEEETVAKTEEPVAETATTEDTKETAKEVFDELAIDSEDVEVEEKKEKRGRKSISWNK